jgi:hypothetical protein
MESSFKYIGGRVVPNDSEGRIETTRLQEIFVLSLFVGLDMAVDTSTAPCKNHAGLRSARNRLLDQRITFETNYPAARNIIPFYQRMLSVQGTVPDKADKLCDRFPPVRSQGLYCQ